MTRVEVFARNEGDSADVGLRSTYCHDHSASRDTDHRVSWEQDRALSRNLPGDRNLAWSTDRRIKCSRRELLVMADPHIDIAGLSHDTGGCARSIGGRLAAVKP